MRLLVASDLHGSLPALHFLLERANELRPDLLVLLGDLVYHGPRNPLPAGYDTPQLLRTMPDLTALPCPVTAVRGNCDAEVDLALLPFPVADNAWIAVDGLRVFASHGHHVPERPPCPGFARGTVLLRGTPTCRAAKPWTGCTSGIRAPWPCPRAAFRPATGCMRTASSAFWTRTAAKCCATPPRSETPMPASCHPLLSAPTRHGAAA